MLYGDGSKPIIAIFWGNTDPLAILGYPVSNRVFTHSHIPPFIKPLTTLW